MTTRRTHLRWTLATPDQKLLAKATTLGSASACVPVSGEVYYKQLMSRSTGLLRRFSFARVVEVNHLHEALHDAEKFVEGERRGLWLCDRPFGPQAAFSVVTRFTRTNLTHSLGKSLWITGRYAPVDRSVSRTGTSSTNPRMDFLMISGRGSAIQTLTTTGTHARRAVDHRIVSSARRKLIGEESRGVHILVLGMSGQNIGLY